MSTDLLINELVNELYHKVDKRGKWGQFWSKLTGRSCYLLSLNKATRNYSVLTRSYAGRRTVPIGQIRGSESRSHDFDCNFYPLRSQNKRRWLGVAKAQQLGTILPAVELIQVGDIYFVRDGHHRISVARVLGQQVIDAEVIAWQISRPLSRQDSVVDFFLSLTKQVIEQRYQHERAIHAAIHKHSCCT